MKRKRGRKKKRNIHVQGLSTTHKLPADNQSKTKHSLERTFGTQQINYMTGIQRGSILKQAYS